MKRTLVLTLFVLFGLTAAQAQRQVALLTHGNDVTVYYGANALVDANTNAVSGDVITLSSGTFAAPTITANSLTIHGMGRYADTALNTTPTVISGDLTLWADSLTLEGMHLTSTLKNGTGTAHSQFIDVYFDLIDTAGSFSLTDCEFVQCNIKMSNQPISSSVFTNCVVIGSFGLNNVCNNCVLNAWNNGVVANNSIFTTYGYDSRGCVINNTNLTNCVGILYDWYTNSRGYENAMCPTGNYHINNLNVFADYSWEAQGWNYIYGQTYRLTDTAAATFLGSDGTQVGVYGGMAPWGTRHLNYKITVPEQSNHNGKLEVTIEPLSEETVTEE